MHPTNTTAAVFSLGQFQTDNMTDDMCTLENVRYLCAWIQDLKTMPMRVWASGVCSRFAGEEVERGLLASVGFATHQLQLTWPNYFLA